MAMSPYARWIQSPLSLFALAIAMVALPGVAAESCSDRKVKRLSRQGNTVASIARTCEMDADDVRDILEEDESDTEPDTSSQAPARPPIPQESRRFPPGTPLAPCGCWGPASPSDRQPNNTCSSGYAMPRMCPQMCPAGGFAWQGVCG